MSLRSTYKYFILLVIPVAICGQVYSQTTGIISGQDTSRRVITTAVPFLLITPDARSGGMGDVGVAISPDANAVHWNPAKIARIENDLGFSLSYTPWLGKIVNDMSISYLSGYKKITREQAVATSLRYFDLGDIQLTDEQGQSLGQFNPREFAFDATYSRILTENFSIGGTIRFIHSNLSGNFTSPGNDGKSGNSVAVDLGVFYKQDLLLSGANSNIAFGALISNIGKKITYSNDSNEDFIPGNLRLGTAFTTNLDPYNSITIALDFNKLLVPTPPIFAQDSTGNFIIQNGQPVIEEGKDPNRSLLSGTFGSFTDAPDGFSEEIKEVTASVGLEYWYKELFAARTGYFHEAEVKGNRQYFTLGLGFRYQMFGIDFAYLQTIEQNHPLAETLRFTLHFNFEKKNNKSVTEG